METPPLTRGRLDESEVVAKDDRNTPAYAGKTFEERGAERAFGNTPAYAGKTET